MEGFYCNATIGPVVWYGAYTCPEGYYCPNGTQYAEQFPCPRGTFNNLTGKKWKKRLCIDKGRSKSTLRTFLLS